MPFYTHFLCCDQCPFIHETQDRRGHGTLILFVCLFFIVCLMYLETIPKASTGWGSYLVCRYLYKSLLSLRGQFPLQETERFSLLLFPAHSIFQLAHLTSHNMTANMYVFIHPHEKSAWDTSGCLDYQIKHI